MTSIRVMYVLLEYLITALYSLAAISPHSAYRLELMHLLRNSLVILH